MNRSPNFTDKLITLDRGYYTTCTINLFGCSITSWCIKNKEQLFLSRNTVFNSINRIHGGIALAFPETDDWEFSDLDGFLKSIMWQVELHPCKVEGSEDIQAILVAKQSSYTKSMYNYDFRIIFHIILHSTSLEMEWKIINDCKLFSLPFKMSVHSFLKVSKFQEVFIVGLKDCNYIRDVSNNEISYSCDNTFSLKNRQDVYMIFRPSPNCFQVRTEDGNFCIRVNSENLPNLSIWNNTNEAMGLTTDEQNKFISIGCGIEEKMFILKPQDTITTKIKLEQLVDDDDVDASDLMYQYDYVNGVLLNFKTV